MNVHLLCTSVTALHYNTFRPTSAHSILEIVLNNWYPIMLHEDAEPVHKTLSFYNLFSLFQEIIRRMNYSPVIFILRMKIGK